MPLAKCSLKRIVLIDDDPDDYHLLKEAMERIDASICLEYMGKEFAQEKGKSLPAPDLLFLDIHMPLNDGFTLLKQIRSGAYQHLPIIMYSTSKDPEQVKKAYELGADLYFTKPFSYKEFLSSLTQVLSLNWEEPREVKKQFIRYGMPGIFSLMSQGQKTYKFSA